MLDTSIDTIWDYVIAYLKMLVPILTDINIRITR